MADTGLQADGSRRALTKGESLYGQSVTHFALKLFLDDHPVDGRVIVDLAEMFLGHLVVPGATPARLHTRRPGLSAKLISRAEAPENKRALVGDFARP